MKLLFSTHRLFFAAAMVQAALSVAIWMFMPPASADAITWHAHELIFGYAMAVIAGFLFTKIRPSAALLVFTLWAAARLTWLFLPDAQIAAAILSVAATAAIAGISASGFLQGVKRAQNLVFPVLLAVTAGCDILSQLHVFGIDGTVARPAILAAVYALTALIVVMGGRITGAALSGLHQRTGGKRIAPRLGLERVLPVLLGGAALAMALDAPPVLLAICALPAAAAILLRLVDWLPVLRSAGPDLMALTAAQAFIAAGLGGIGLRVLDPSWNPAAPLHLLTIGGIGITTVTMMLRTTAQRERRPLAATTTGIAAIMLALAAILRTGGGVFGELGCAGAAVAWCLAMLCCAVRLLWR
ncbi:MAG: NnrS family protein [Alphaproteobacteria bacterium]|nr:NnrS family protein [Alphaproteobacteria bacterium]